MHLHLLVRRFSPFCLLVLIWLGAADVRAAGDASRFRVFLRDGTSVAILGEFARVGDRVVFTVALPAVGSQAERLQAVTLPASAVDWAKTDEYAITVRAAQYAASQGEADYASLTANVARALSQVAERQNPLERLQLAEQVRGIVSTWNRDHYAYRANEVRQIQALLDELVSELRAEAGIPQFDLNLVASVEPPPTRELPPPTLVESIQQALRVAKASDVPAERAALNRAIVELLDGTKGVVPGDVAKRARSAATEALDEDARVDRAYRDLAAAFVGRARGAAAHADADGVEKLLDDLRRRDQRLGAKRPEQMAALVASLQAQLDAARRLRLARDHWQAAQPAMREYERLVRGPMRDLDRARKALDAIKRLSGPDPDTVRRTKRRLQETVSVLQRVVPPPDVAPAHATLASASHLALRAVELRERAITSGDLQVAWEASSAAAGTAMLMSQAREQLMASLRFPELW